MSSQEAYVRFGWPLDTASAWRHNPADPYLTQALMTAIDERDQLGMRTRSTDNG